MSCYIYWDKILKISQTLSKFNDFESKSLPLDKFLPLLGEIEEIAHDKNIGFDDAKHILSDKKMGPALDVIREFYIDIAERLEVEKAQEILQSHDPWKTLESFYFFDHYQKLIQNEHGLIPFVPGEKIVFIGGGPLPLTLIMLHKFYGIHGISIEIIPEIAALSKEIIKKLRLDQYIDVVVGDETYLSHLEYDVVMVAALAEPKERVFKNIRKQIDQSIPVIYRTYMGMRAILYAPVTEDVLKGFKRENMVLPTGKVNNTSVLIKKEV
ncbi:nicotianamine synthase family protein [Methanobacterium sp.]|uniref:nicotianamine synthase family protein n=1 Tax=Methanobacterium sp. TaxID=2164 RepID=UPI003158D9CD